ncbi:ComEC/Rec2 family competence protein [Nostocoides australiense]
MWGQTRDGSVRLDPRGHARQTRPGDGHPDRRPGVDLRLLVPALFGWGATALTLGVGGGIRVIIGAVALVVAAWPAWLGRARHRRGGGALRMAALVAAVTGVLVATAGLADLRRRAGVVDELANRGGVGRISGPVVAEPVPIDNGRFVVRLRAETVLSAGQVTRSSATMLVIGDDRWSHLQWRDHVDVLVRMRPADPGDSVLAIAKPLYGPTSRPASSRLVAWSSHIRGALRGAVSALPPDAQGLVPAMVFGDTSRSPPELTSDMRAAGLAHLSAVSGANVSILVVCAVAGLGVFGVRRRWRPAALLLVIAAFVVVTRPEPSVIRAAAMGGVGVLACYRSTRAAGIPALGAAIVGLLMADPWLARSFGFALSALATLGLLVFAGPWSRAVVQRFPRCPAPIAVAVVVPVAAQVTTAPVLVLLQGNVSVVGIPANILAAPFVAPVTIAGLGLATLAALGLPTGWLAWAPGAPALAITWIAHRAAGVSWGSIDWPDGAAGAMLLTGGTLLLLVTAPRLRYAARVRPRTILAGLLLSLAAVLPTGWWGRPPGPWQLVACDVGQGDALVVATTPGRGILVDAGPEPLAVDRCLRRLSVKALDLIVLTHFHADHVDGLAGALRGRSVAGIVTSPVADPPDRAATVARLAGQGGIPLRPARLGEQLRFGATTLSILGPARRIDAGSVPNNASVVLTVRIGDFDALLTGDVEAEAGRSLRLTQQANLFGPQSNPRFDVVKAPHHGSANYDDILFAETRAPVTLVSVGADNDYGHPAPRFLDAAAALGTRVLRTDQAGDIALWVAGGQLYVRTDH